MQFCVGDLVDVLNVVKAENEDAHRNLHGANEGTHNLEIIFPAFSYGFVLVI